VTTNQTDLTSMFITGRVRHNADIGLEITRDKQPTKAVTDAFTNGRPPVVDLFNPDPYAPYRPALVPTGATSDAHAASTALYVFDTLTISPRWQADLGLRWDHITIDYRTVSATGAVADFGRTDRALTGRSGVVFKPMNAGSIYAAFSTSFAPSYDGAHGLTVAATGANNQALAPERSHNIEIGTKWGLARSLELSTTAFRMAKTNAKTVDTSGATVLAGDQDVKGVEIGLNGNITERWGAFAGMAIMDGTVKHSGNPIEVGQRLAYVPRAAFNVWLTYRLPMGLTLGGGGNYSSGHYFNQTGTFLYVSNRFDTRYVDNAAAIQALTKYWVFNAVAIYPVNRHLQVQINANNLGDRKYADRAYDRHFLPGPRRQVLIAPTITF
jgi:catecholate siderophore receptor